MHIGYLLVSWCVILVYVNRSTATRFRKTLRLLQIIPVMFALDMIIGIAVIESMYDSHVSASWISKSAMIYPPMFFAAVWFMFKSRRTQKNP